MCQAQNGAFYFADDMNSGQVAGGTLKSQENTRDWAETGLKLANDMTGAGGSAGDVVVYAPWPRVHHAMGRGW